MLRGGGHQPRPAHYLIPHVGLELELQRRAEDLVAHVHDGVLVAPRVQVVHGVLDDVQALVAGGFQVVLGRQVCPEGPSEAGVESQIAALRNTKEGSGHTNDPTLLLEGHVYVRHPKRHWMSQRNTSPVIPGCI